LAIIPPLLHPEMSISLSSTTLSTASNSSQSLVFCCGVGIGCALPAQAQIHPLVAARLPGLAVTRKGHILYDTGGCSPQVAVAWGDSMRISYTASRDHCDGKF